MRRAVSYFAYGSNMLAERMRARAPQARAVESALLYGYALEFHKRGRDGSGKCSVRRDAAQHVAGVVFALDEAALNRLDRVEGPGYRRIEVIVAGLSSRRRYRAHCYAAKASAVDDACIAFAWYRDIVVAGAVANELPCAYIDRLLAHPVRPDPNPRRHRQHMWLLGNGAPTRGTCRRWLCRTPGARMRRRAGI